MAPGESLCVMSTKGARITDICSSVRVQASPSAILNFSNEILHLRKLAGIESQVCPHMFRHAMITRLFTQFIARHQLNNADDFRRALLDTETFKAEVAEWTGHLDPDSVENYIHLAFRDLSGYTETLSSTHLTLAMEQVLHTLKRP